MTHQYRQRILVTLRANGEPDAIFWRGAAYHVAEVFARWHLRDRWWEAQSREARASETGASETGASETGPSAGDAPVGDAPTRNAASDRHYYRLCCAEGLLCEVYWDAAAAVWILDRVID